MEESAIKTELRSFILENFDPGISAAELTDELSIIETGLVDSMKALRLFAHVEEEYDISIEPDEMLPENMGTLSKLARFVHSKRTGGKAAASGAGYYRVIDGTKYDRGILDEADEAVKGKGDGRISLDDAKKVLAKVKDGSNYTDIEKSTMKYVRDNYKFTDEADAWFRTEIRKWAATK